MGIVEKIEGVERGAQPCGFVAVLGATNAGKSTLINRIIGHKIAIVSPKVQTTRNRIVGVKSSAEGQIVFVDTPGFAEKPYGRELEKYMHRACREAVSGVDLEMLVVDSARMLRDAGAGEDLEALCESHGVSSPAIVALNKIDLVNKADLLPLMAELDQRLGRDKGREIELIPISAREGDGIDILENSILSRLPRGEYLFPEDVITDQADEFLACEIIREKLFLHLHAELPYSLAVGLESWEEKADLLRLKALIFVERNSQKGIVIGQGGGMLKTVGTEARLELERVFGIRVFLEIRVRVEKDWTRSLRGLRKTGYGHESE